MRKYCIVLFTKLEGKFMIATAVLMQPMGHEYYTPRWNEKLHNGKNTHFAGELGR